MSDFILTYKNEHSSTVNGEKFHKYIFESSNSTYFCRCNVRIVFPKVVQLFLDNSIDEDIDKLLSRNFALRIKLLSDGNKSYIDISVGTINGYSDVKIKELFNNLESGFIPCEIKLGEYEHFMSILQDCIIEKNINIGYCYHDLEYEDGLNMLGRVRYAGETDEEIEEKQRMYGYFILTPILLIDRYNDFQTKWNKAKERQIKRGIMDKYSEIFIATYKIFVKNEKEIHICTLTNKVKTYLPNTEYLYLLDLENNDFQLKYGKRYIKLQNFVKYFNLKKFHNPKDCNVLYYECDIFPTEEQITELMIDSYEFE